MARESGILLFGWFGLTIIGLAAPLVGALLGMCHLDLENFSGFHRLVEISWGLWYSPIILLGYDYPLHPKLGIILMIVFCVIFGVLLDWLRLATGSLWPSAIGHGALNASGAFFYAVTAADQPIDTAQVTILGWTGWRSAPSWSSFFCLS
jgi:membrane protease YdiL (CAAX protease family)